MVRKWLVELVAEGVERALTRRDDQRTREILGRHGESKGRQLLRHAAEVAEDPMWLIGLLETRLTDAFRWEFARAATGGLVSVMRQVVKADARRAHESAAQELAAGLTPSAPDGPR